MPPLNGNTYWANTTVDHTLDHSADCTWYLNTSWHDNSTSRVLHYTRTLLLSTYTSLVIRIELKPATKLTKKGNGLVVAGLGTRSTKQGAYTSQGAGYSSCRVRVFMASYGRLSSYYPCAGLRVTLVIKNTPYKLLYFGGHSSCCQC